MDLYAMSDEGLLKELGGRLRKLRLSKNLSQERVAEIAGLGRTTVVSLEAGNNPKLITLLQVLRALEALDALNDFIPEPGISPLKLLEMKGRERRRASRKISAGKEEKSGW